MIRVSQIKLLVSQDISVLYKKVSNILRIHDAEIENIIIRKKSIDARKKPDIYYLYTVDVMIKDEKRIIKRLPNNCIIVNDIIWKPLVEKSIVMHKRPIIIGAGPAGLFCAYILALNGKKPILLERGEDVRTRKKVVDAFWNSNVLQKNSNVQFGEGGAGTFSDGKLNTLVKDKTGKNRFVLETFVKFGAADNILYDAKPHIGTDVLIDVIENMRNEIIQLGGEIRFSSLVTDIIINQGKITAVQVNETELIETEHVVLAIGHSARDTFHMLFQKKIAMQAKSFAVGFRVEHPRVFIDESQYGMQKDSKLPTAAYKLTAQASNGRGVYTFCMCPGGYVVNASSEEGRLAINGMSYHDRMAKHSNSAIIVTVTPDDFDKKDALSGVRFQQAIEEKAFQVGNGLIPVECFADFERNVIALDKIDSKESCFGELTPCMKGKYLMNAAVHDILPKELNQAFVEGIHSFGRKIKGYDDPQMLVSGIESRTSSPVRIDRDENGVSISTIGLYPCGEGAGYAGGIMSAAMDGIFIAERILGRK